MTSLNLGEVDSRSIMLLGENNISKLHSCTVVIYGLGGVGSYVAESLARCGLGHLHIVDNDNISISNINRQLVATNETIGMPKTEVMKKRINSIRNDITVTTNNTFVLHDINDSLIELNNSKIDYIVDAIDTVTAKLAIAEYATNNNIPIISAMGTGNKLHPEMLEITDIKNTSVCPLCKVMRKELKNRGIDNYNVVYSKEKPIKTDSSTPGSLPFVPGSAGLIIASLVVREITGIDNY